MLRLPTKTLNTVSVLTSSLSGVPADGHSVTQLVHKCAVLDGGALLHTVCWRKSSTYKQMIDQYIRYVTHNYGSNVTVVFDGYTSGPSTKDHEHIRQRRRVAATVEIHPHAVVHSNQAAFLSSAQNKCFHISSNEMPEGDRLVIGRSYR